MVIASSSIDEKDRNSRFFKEIFLLADISMYVAFGMSFLTLSNVQIDFNDRELRQRLYTPAEILLTTHRVKLVGKKEFATLALSPDNDTFVIHIASITSSDPAVNPSYSDQIASLKADEILITIPSKYIDFTDVFSLDLAAELLEYIGINKHTIS